MVVLAFSGGYGLALRLGSDAGSGGEGYVGGREKNLRTRAVSLLFEELNGQLPAEGAVQALAAFTDDSRLALRNLMRLGDPEERAFKARLLAEEFPLGRLASAVAYVDNLPRGPRQEEVFFVLLQRWGELDGRSALAYALAEGGTWDREGAVRAVLAGWTSADAVSVWRWILQNPSQRSRDALRFNAVVDTLTPRNPDQAYAFASSLRDNGMRASALETFSRRMIQTGPPQRVLSWLEEQAAGETRARTLAYAAGEIARYSPREALAWIGRQQDPLTRDLAMVRVARSWAQYEPAQACQWAAGLDPGGARHDALAEAAEGWLQRDGPAPLAQWLNSVPAHPDFDGALQKLVFTVSESDPATALSWAHTLIDPTDRDFSTIAIARHWMETDPEAAVAALNQDPAVSEQVRLVLFGSTRPVDQAVGPVPVAPPVVRPVSPEEMDEEEGYFDEMGEIESVRD